MKTYFKITITLFLTILLSCTTVPDDYTIIRNNEIKAYILETSQYYDDHYIDSFFTPNNELEIMIIPSYYWYYYNSSKLHLRANVYTTNQYTTLNIKELKIVYEDKIISILQNKTYIIEGVTVDDKLVYKNNDYVIIEGKQYYKKHINLDENINSYLFKGKKDSEITVKIIQKYNFDNQETKTEIYKYTLKRGGFEFDIFRPIMMFFPP